MIYLITGNPGAGKSVEAISLALKLCGGERSLRATTRPLYVTNVREFRYDLTGAHPLDHVRDWQQLPDGSVVLVDEVQDQIPQRDRSVRPPDWVQELAKHRHRGFDFIFVTQHPSNMDVFVRRIVNEHRHIRRKPRALSFMTGFRRGSLRITWDRFEPRMEDFFAQRRAVKTGAVWDPRVFRLYTSTTLDTHSPKVPWQVPALLFGIIAVVSLFAVGISRFTDSDTDTDTAAAPSQAVAPPAGGVSPPAAPPTAASVPHDRLAQFVPRVQGIMWTAPAFDHLAPTTSPRTLCMSSGAGLDGDGRLRPASCVCMTEQGTLIEGLTHEYCVRAARHGIYDYFRTDRDVPQSEDA